MRSILALLAVPLLAVPLLTVAAQAASLPLHLEGNVVEFAITKVDLPTNLPGVCHVNGIAAHVWAGKTYQPGEKLALKVPCGTLGLIHANVSFDAAPVPVDVRVLRRARLAVAHLDDKGSLDWNATSDTYGRWGAVSGLRLDAAILPAL